MLKQILKINLKYFRNVAFIYEIPHIENIFMYEILNFIRQLNFIRKYKSDQFMNNSHLLNFSDLHQSKLQF